MEYRELYDQNRNKIGKCILKGEKVPKDLYYIVCLIFIENNEGQFLIQKRVKEKDGKFGFTGGHVKKGETSYEGIITETKEEIGIDLSNKELILFDTKKTDYCFFDLYYVKMNLDINKITLQKDEVESISFLNFDEIDDLVKNDKVSKNHVIMYESFKEFYKNKY